MTMLSLAREWPGLLSMDALISITGMLVCLFGLVRVIVAYSGTTRSAAPDPERVKRSVNSGSSDQRLSRTQPRGEARSRARGRAR